MAGPRTLDALEASFLGIEGPGIPMHVAGVTVFHGRPPVTMDEVQRLMRSRIRRLPRFRERVEGDPLALTRPHWARARLDIDDHLFHHRLAGAGRHRDLFALCARIQETPMSRDQPLWEAHLIDGLEGGDQALLLKTHHAITDGLAGIEIASVLFDPADGSPRPRLLQTRFAAARPVRGLAAVQSLLGLAFYGAGGPLAAPGPFNGPVGPHRIFGAVAIPMELVLESKRRLGGSVDDVIVAAVSAGIYRYLVDVGFPEIPHALRAMLPVSTRRATRGVQLGNQVSSVFIDLPMRSIEAADLLPDIARAKTTLRLAHAAAGGSLLVEAAALLPAPLHRQVVRVTSALPFAHLVLSDVPGPGGPLRFLGRPIKVCYPVMPLTRNIGLSIATISMAGTVGIGVTADPNLVPDPQRLASEIRRAFAALAPGRAVRRVTPRAA